MSNATSVIPSLILLSHNHNQPTNTTITVQTPSVNIQQTSDSSRDFGIGVLIVLGVLVLVGIVSGIIYALRN